MTEMISATRRLPRKSMFVSAIRSAIVILRRRLKWKSQRKRFRVMTSAVNIEAMMPMVSVTAKPRHRAGGQQIKDRRRDERGDVRIEDRGERLAVGRHRARS